MKELGAFELLPAEVRHEIYYHLFAHAFIFRSSKIEPPLPRDLFPPSESSYDKRAALAFLRVSKQIYCEASSVLYGESVFFALSDLKDLLDFLATIGPTKAAVITHIVLRMPVTQLGFKELERIFNLTPGLRRIQILECETTFCGRGWEEIHALNVLVNLKTLMNNHPVLERTFSNHPEGVQIYDRKNFFLSAFGIEILGSSASECWKAVDLTLVAKDHQNIYDGEEFDLAQAINRLYTKLSTNPKTAERLNKFHLVERMKGNYSLRDERLVQALSYLKRNVPY
ncbi:MAG: hypothetical protein Q9227_000409 [Pyrenula ochraceoflavens]